MLENKLNKLSISVLLGGGNVKGATGGHALGKKRFDANPEL